MQLLADCESSFVWMDEVLRIVSEHPEYPEPCPMLHEVAAKAASEMNKEWVIHMVRETCRQTKEAILADLKQFLPNETSPSMGATEKLTGFKAIMMQELRKAEMNFARWSNAYNDAERECRISSYEQNQASYWKGRRDALRVFLTDFVEAHQK
jgi:hypothetical protein